MQFFINLNVTSKILLKEKQLNRKMCREKKHSKNNKISSCRVRVAETTQWVNSWVRGANKSGVASGQNDAD
jgi:hypothetical protein